MNAKDIEIISAIGTIAQKLDRTGAQQTLELNLIRLKGRPVYDVRWWVEGQPLYGLSLTERALAELGELIEQVFSKES